MVYNRSIKIFFGANMNSKEEIPLFPLLKAAQIHLVEFLSLSTKKEFSEQLTNVINQLMKEDERLKELGASALEEKLLKDKITSEDGTETTLLQEQQHQQIVGELAKLLKTDKLVEFQTQLKKYETNPSIDKFLSKKFLGPDGKQTCLLNLAIEKAYDNKSIAHIKELIALGANINMDFGYHAQRHPNREVPPLVKAIQLSNESQEKKKFYTDLTNYLISKGASVNKIGDNPSPLWAAYNPLAIPYSLSRAATRATIGSNAALDLHAFRKQYASHLRNKETFQHLLERGAKTDEFDIISSPVKTPVAPPNMNGPKAFQMLYFIDEDLRNGAIYDEPYRKQLKQDFFDPLFEKTYTIKLANGEKLQGYTFKFLNKAPNDVDIASNTIYLYMENSQLKYAVNESKNIKRDLLPTWGILSSQQLDALKEACQTQKEPEKSALEALSKCTTKLGYPQRENFSQMNQQQLDEMVRRGEIFSNVTARYTGHVSDFLTRIKTNDSGYIMSFIFTKDEKPFNMLENQCIAGEYNVPTHYYAARSRQMLEGVGFFYKHVQPHMTVKTDMFSVPRDVKYYDAERDGDLPSGLSRGEANRSLSVAVALDLEFKLSNLDPQRSYEKAQDAEARRTLKIKEHRFRPNVDKGIEGPKPTSKFIDLSVKRTASTDELIKSVKKESGRTKPLHHSRIYNVKESDYFEHNIELIPGKNIKPELTDLKENTIHFYLNNDVLKCIARIDDQMMNIELRNLKPEVINRIKNALIDGKKELSSEDILHIVENIDHKFHFPTSVYHGECLADIYQFDMILDIKNPQHAANLSPEERHRRLHQKKTAENVGEDLYDSLLDVRALQKQRQAFLFTGREVPIARTDATTGAIKVLNIDEISTVRKLIWQVMTTSKKRQHKIYKRFVDLDSLMSEPLTSQDLHNALSKFAQEANFDKLVKTLNSLEREYLLLWALDMGFRDLACELIIRDVKLSGTLGCEKRILINTIEKGLVDEAMFLMENGISLNDHELHGLKTAFDGRFNYLCHFNNVLQLMQQEPEDKMVHGGKVYLYVKNDILMYAVSDQYHIVSRTPINASGTISQERIDSIKNSIRNQEKLSNSDQKALSKVIPDSHSFGMSARKLDIHFGEVFTADKLAKFKQSREEQRQILGI